MCPPATSQKNGVGVAGNDVTQNTRAAGAIRQTMSLTDDADGLDACDTPFGDDGSGQLLDGRTIISLDGGDFRR